MLSRWSRLILKHPFAGGLLLAMILLGGLLTAPSGWKPSWLPDYSLAVDALPDIGENQQIVFTSWPGRSPQEIEDQITYPLLVQLMGIPGLKTTRSTSMFGRSSIYLSFEQDRDAYWCRSRILEKLNALPPDVLPPGLRPQLGPNASALGQVFWYTLESKNEQGELFETWSLEELRRIHDYYVQYGLQSVKGVAEVAAIGGQQRTFRVQLQPSAMKAAGVTLKEVIHAIQHNNRNAGGHTLEVNRMEYLIRGIGEIESLDDLGKVAVRTVDNTPILLQDIASIGSGVSNRRGILDKGGLEAVGGVVAMEYGANPQQVIQDLKEQLAIIESGLPRKEMKDGQFAQLKIVPFYDRSELVAENLKTLHHTLITEILIAAIVIFFMLRHWQAALVIGASLPLAIGLTYLLMRFMGWSANSLSLAGIAIAIGSMVDMGIIWVDHVLQQDSSTKSWKQRIIHSGKEIMPAILTAAATTILSFLPVLFLGGMEGQLFRPLALTKTLALGAALLILVSILPVVLYVVLQLGRPQLKLKGQWASLLLGALLLVLLWQQWQSTGLWAGLVRLSAFAGLLLFFQWIGQQFEVILRFCFSHYRQVLMVPVVLILGGTVAWWNLDYGYLPEIDEGAFLLMPATPDHVGEAENQELLQLLDRALMQIPEVREVVGKVGRADSPLDPAPLSMFEILIHYHPAYGYDESGRWRKLWRDHIRHPNDIWEEIVSVVREIPGLTLPPKLQPIETRLLMLQSGSRAPLGLLLKAQNQRDLDQYGRVLEAALGQIPELYPASIYREEQSAKPYLDLVLRREHLAPYGLTVEQVQQHIEVLLGNMPVGRVLDGREHYAIEVSYPATYEQRPETLAELPILLAGGAEVPLGELAEIRFEEGPATIKSEDGFLTQALFFEQAKGISAIEAAEAVDRFLKEQRMEGTLLAPPGLTMEWTGTFQEFQRSKERMRLIIGLTILIILLVLYIQFQEWPVVAIVFSGMLLAIAGGFMGLWAYNLLTGQGWLGLSLQPVLLTIPVGIGFLALLGLATDDGVLMATFIRQKLKSESLDDSKKLEAQIIAAGKSRIRPAMMTTATTVLALLPIFWGYGRGAELMQPMAIPLLAGLFFQLLTVFWVPLLYYLWMKKKLAYE